MKKAIFIIIMLAGCATIPGTRAQIDNILDSGVLDKPTMTATERAIVKGSIKSAAEQIEDNEIEIIKYREKTAEQKGVNKVLVAIITAITAVIAVILFVKLAL